MTNKEFEKQYGAELLPASASNYAVGDIWDWQRISKPFGAWVLKYQATNIAEVINEKQIEKQLNSLKAMDAMLPEIDATKELKLDTGIEIPSINLKIDNKLSTKGITKISFGNVTCKNIKGFRVDLSKKLETFKIIDYDIYRKFIRDNDIAIQLYYSGNVLIEVDKTISDVAEIKAKIEEIDLKCTTSVLSNKKTLIKISSLNSPFAAELIKGNNF